jgi:hypothetical protein
MDTNLIYILIILFWIWSLETLYMEMRHHKDYLSYTNFKRDKFIRENQLKYVYINLYLYLSQ